MAIGQQGPRNPPRVRLNKRERLTRLTNSVSIAYATSLGKSVYRDLGQKPWYARQRLKQLDARILAHGGQTGAGITRPRERRAGEPPYKDKADAIERRWLAIPAAEA